ncbi:MAG TPA: NAD(P)-dependent oxidoreductase [Xanthobacteraceae bacterium]|jgi:3-hydroxyisobutyrate dehydrogenase-like beta-hydroxyacid dehydrogenase|nr:NAD(P)-dependent oxidoreductase [Xanthobacteraceae bacterium]
MANDLGELIGIVGVGRMGLAIAKHLMKHGYRVIAQDIDATAMEAARAAGARTVATPAGVGQEAAFVIIAVGYDDEAAAVMLDKDGLLESMTPGGVISVSSTCTPDHVKMLAARAAATYIELLDAPICRGQRAADAGTMLSLCGGKPAIFERALPILKTYSADVVHLGDVGAGQFGKALNNFLLWVNGIALIEAGRLSEANGMDLVKLRDTLLISSGASDALKNWDNVSFTWALKDMQIVSKMADKAGLALPIAGAVKELVKDGLRIKRTNPPDWTGRNKR